MGAAELRPLDRPGDLGWVVERHGVLYALEFGWDQSFEALVARIVADFADGPRDPDRETGWIAEVDGRRAGSVFCVASGRAGVAKLRALLVEPEARGHGVGRMLVERCLAFAREAGYARIELWTTANLEAARRLYDGAGFEVVREVREEAFGTEVLSRHMELELR